MSNSSSDTDRMEEFAPPASRRLNSTYWLCNIIEMWERLAYYTLRPVAPIYIMQATEPGGLHLTAQHKGVIYMWWAVIQSILPMATGGFADRYGYKNSLAFSITVNIIGYLMMAFTHSYEGFFAGIVILAFGTSFFKPSLQATLGHQLSKESSSLGWGVFYWIVNVGSLIGHYVSPLLLNANRADGGWRTLFLACAGFTAMNYIMLFTYRDVPSGASKTQNPLGVLWTTIRHVFEPRLFIWLMIMSCFWMMMYQLWDLQPNFIVDWVDSSKVAAWAPFESWRETGPNGQLRVPQQVLLSLNALLIVCLMVPVSWAVRRMRALSAMFFGMVMATAGVLVAGMTGNGWFLLLGIVCFSLGEMLTGPKKNEYLNLIAPPGKRGLYLGYVNIPVGVGVGAGSYIAGVVYGNYGEKATLALKYLVQHTSYVAGKTWDGSVATLETVTGVSRTEAFAKLQAVLGVDADTATKLLWDTYHPQYHVWIPFAATGFAAAIALAIFGQLAKRWKDMNA
ncbi:MAG: MFS transporter [Phycisphaerae bacterium]|nr:MFS transporter [Phycisphaerae bacterium]